MDPACLCLSLCFAVLLGMTANTVTATENSTNVTESTVENGTTPATIPKIQEGTIVTTVHFTDQEHTQIDHKSDTIPTHQLDDDTLNGFISMELLKWVIMVAVPVLFIFSMVLCCCVFRQRRQLVRLQNGLDTMYGVWGAEGGAGVGLSEPPIKMEEVKLQEVAKEETAKDDEEQGAVKAGDSGNGEAARESTAQAAGSSQSEESPATAAEGEMEALVVV